MLACWRHRQILASFSRIPLRNAVTLSARSIPTGQARHRPAAFIANGSARYISDGPRRYTRFDDPDPPPGGSNKGNNGSDGSNWNNLWIQWSRWYARNTLGAQVGMASILLGSIYFVMHLEKVPESGRWRFMNVSARREKKLEARVQAQVLKEFGDHILPFNHPLSRQVREVASRILTASNLGVVKGENLASSQQQDDIWNPDDGSSSLETSPSDLSQREWQVIVINDPKLVNAFAVPGLVAVSTGMIPILQNEQGLAAVLGHEIGHVVLRHSVEKVSSGTLIIALLVLVSFLGFEPGLVDRAGALLYELPNSRKAETEADSVGLKLMAKACYDPAAAPAMFSRLMEMENGMIRGKEHRGLRFFSTHPLTGDRIKALNSELSAAYDLRAETSECASIVDKIAQFARFSQQTQRGPTQGPTREHEQQEEVW
ncbi:peptidase family M48-domain-containing protein [Mycena floridula]|nr:peptidase family M48-domain-containing protein [Mycena floridula]